MGFFLREPFLKTCSKGNQGATISGMPYKSFSNAHAPGQFESSAGLDKALHKEGPLVRRNRGPLVRILDASLINPVDPRQGHFANPSPCVSFDFSGRQALGYLHRQMDPLGCFSPKNKWPNRDVSLLHNWPMRDESLNQKRARPLENMCGAGLYKQRLVSRLWL